MPLASAGRSSSSSSIAAHYNQQRRIARLKTLFGDDLDEATLFELSASPLPDQEIVTSVMRASELANVRYAVEQMNQLSIEDQAARWNSSQFTPQRQALWINNGYSAPEIQAQQAQADKSWWETGVEFVGEGISNALQGPLAVGGALMEGFTIAGDTFAGRPYRAQEAMQGGEQIALQQGVQAFDARAQVEERLGVQFTDEQWKGAFGRFFDRNPHRYTSSGGSADVGDFFGSGIIESLSNTGTALAEGGPMAGGIAAWELANPDESGEVRNLYTEQGYQYDPAMPDEVYREFERTMFELSSTAEYGAGPREAFEQVATGQDWIPPSKQVQVYAALKGVDDRWEVFDWVRAKANGARLEEYLSNDLRLVPETPEFAAAFKEFSDLEPNPSFQEAYEIAAADANRVSLGRDFTRQIGVNDDTPYLFNVLSGSIDATHVLTFDPTLAAGGAIKLMRGAKWAVGGVDGISQVLRRAHAGRYADELGAGVHLLDDVAPEAIRAGQGAHINLRGVLDERWTEKGLAHAAMFDEAGRPTEFLARNFEAIDDAVRASFGDALAEARRLHDYEKVAELRNLRTALDGTVFVDEARGGLRGMMDAYKVRLAETQYRAAERIAKAVKKRDAASLRVDMPWVDRGMPALIEHDAKLRAINGKGIQTAEDVFNFYRSTEGMQALARGLLTPTHLTSNALELPRLTKFRQATRSTSNKAGGAIDWLRTSGVPERVLTATGQESYAQRLGMTLGEKAWYRFTGFTTRGPGKLGSAVTHRAFGDSIPLIGQDAAPTIERLLDFGAFADLPRDAQRAYYNQFMFGIEVANDTDNAWSVASRIQTTKAILDDLFGRAGIYDNPETKRWADDLFKKSESFAYAPENYDQWMIGDALHTAAVLPMVQHSAAMQLPPINQLAAQTRKIGYMSEAFGKFNHSSVDRFMSGVWKPLLLMRPGFILRAGGEELFSMLARSGLAGVEAMLANQAASDNVTWPAWILERLMGKDLGRLFGATPDQMARMNLDEYLTNAPADVIKDAVEKGMKPRARDRGRAMLDAYSYREARMYRRLKDWIDADVTKFREANWEGELNAWDRIGYRAEWIAASVTDTMKRGKLSLVRDDQVIAATMLLPDAVADRLDVMDLRQQYHELYGATEMMSKHPAMSTYFDENVSGTTAWYGDRPWGDPGDKVIATYDDPTGVPQYFRVGNSGAWQETHLADDRLDDEVAVSLGGAYDQLFQEPVVYLNTDVLRGRLSSDELFEVRPVLEGTPIDPTINATRRLDDALDARAAEIAGEGTHAELKVRARESGVPAGKTKIDTARRIAEGERTGSKPTWVEEWVDAPGAGTADEIAALENELLAATEQLDAARAQADAGMGQIKPGDRPGLPDDVGTDPALTMDVQAAERLVADIEQRITTASAPPVLGRKYGPGVKANPTPMVTDDDTLEMLHAVEYRLDEFGDYTRQRILQWLSGSRVTGRNAKTGRTIPKDVRQKLTPGVRAALDEAPPGSPIEELVHIAADDDDVMQVLDVLAQMPHSTAQAVASEIPVRILDRDALRAELVDAYGRTLQDTEVYGHWLRDWQPALTGQAAGPGYGLPVLNPPRQDVISMYVPMLDSKLADDLTARITDANGRVEILDELLAAGLDPDLAPFVSRMLVEWDSEGITRFLTAASIEQRSTALIPVSHVAGATYEDIAAVTDAFRNAYGTAVRPGYREMPDLDKWLADWPDIRPERLDDVGDIPGYSLDDVFLHDVKAMPVGEPERLLAAEPELAEGYTRWYIPVVDGTPQGEFVNSLPKIGLDRVPVAYLDRPRGAGDLPDPPPIWRDDTAAQVQYLDPTEHVRVGVTFEENIPALAERVVNNVLHHVAPHDRILHEVVEPAAHGRLTPDALRRTAEHDLPQSWITQRKFVAPKTGIWGRVVKYGFDRAIGPAISAMVRRPMFVMNYAKSLEAVRPLAEMMRRPALYAAADDVLGTAGLAMDDLRRLWWAAPDHTRHQLDDVAAFRGHLGGIEQQMRDQADALARLDDAAVQAGGEVSAGEQIGQLLDQIDRVAALRDLDDDALELLRRTARHDEHVDQVVMDTAAGRATNMTVPYIDDHDIKSYFQVYARNVMPFQFATEQFFKRWARTMVHSPEALRRAQLMVHGFMQSGIVEDDPVRGATFTLPLSEYGGVVLNKVPVLRNLFGGMTTVPIGVPLTGDVEQMLPGVPGDLNQLPSLSPLAQIPLDAVKDLFPEFAPVINPFLGRAAELPDRPLWQKFMPAYMSRLLTATMPDNFGSPEELNSSMVGALQQMEAQASVYLQDAAAARADGNMELTVELEGKAAAISVPDQDATAEDIEHWMDEVKTWARQLMAVRGVMGFFSPATPKPDFNDGQGLALEFIELLEHMPIDEALPLFLAEHRDGAPYAIFASTKESGAPLTPTEAAAEWGMEHQDLLQQYPRGAAWLMPQANSTDEFDNKAYADQIAMGLRRRRAPEEWYHAWKIQAAAPTYFKERDRFEIEMELATEDPDRRRMIQATFNEWADRYKAQHPLFAASLTGEGKIRRQQTIDELRLAFADPRRPIETWHAPMETMVREYDRYQSMIDELEEDRRKIATEQRDKIKDVFARWGEQYILDHPEAYDLWRTLIEPAANLTERRRLREALGG